MSRFQKLVVGWWVCFLGLSPLLVGCQGRPWQDVPSDIWWKDAVFYEVFVRSFYDSNGDGIGDFKGLTEKLDYLNDGDPQTTTDLGVTALWLMPIHPSPSYHGYDVTDYRVVNPDYGTLEDFKALLQAAHARGIRVIMDFVVNHTSVEHPWFKASASGDERYRDWYLWADENPGYPGPWGDPAWHELNGRYYYGVFWSGMPDLNYNNPEVTAEIESIAAFWLKEVGVDGFRLDGAKHLIEDGQTQENTAQTHAWLKSFHAFVKGVSPEAVVVGEVWSPSEQTAPYVQNGELDLAFNFPLADEMISAASFYDGRRMSTALMQQARIYGEALYAPFLSNHDQPRVMTRLLGDEDRARGAASLLLTAPGVPFLYYGEEIGMSGGKPDPSIRTPMQWSAEDQAGFTRGTPWEPVNPDYPQKNVAAQSGDDSSLLAHYRRLIAIRNQHYALRSGAYVPVKASNSRLFASLRTAEKETLLVLVNLGKEPISAVELSWEESPLRGEYRPTLLLGKGAPARLKVGEKGEVSGFRPVEEIAPFSTVIIQYRSPD